MDPKAPRESLQNLGAIWRQFEDCRSTFLSPSDLQAFGVEARHVGTTDDGVPQFEPRYFEPHPEEVLRKYPIDAAANNYDVRRLEYIPTLQGALDTVRETIPASEDPLEAAQKLLEKRLEKYHFWDDYAHADSIHCHIEYELGAIREGGHPLFSLDELTGIGEWVYVKKESLTL